MASLNSVAYLAQVVKRYHVESPPTQRNLDDLRIILDRLPKPSRKRFSITSGSTASAAENEDERQTRAVEWLRKYQRTQKPNTPAKIPEWVLVDLGESPDHAAPEVVFCGKGLYRCGADAIRLDSQEAIVLQTLVELRAATKDLLANKSGVTNAVSVLAQIRKNHPMLAAVITLPGAKNRGGYRTTIRPE